MSFHHDSFHQTNAQIKELLVDMGNAFERIYKLEKQIEKILDRDSEFWTEEE